MSKRLRASMRAANKGRNLRPRASQIPPEPQANPTPGLALIEADDGADEQEAPEAPEAQIRETVREPAVARESAPAPSAPEPIPVTKGSQAAPEPVEPPQVAESAPPSVTQPSTPAVVAKPVVVKEAPKEAVTAAQVPPAPESFKAEEPKKAVEPIKAEEPKAAASVKVPEPKAEEPKKAVEPAKAAAPKAEEPKKAVEPAKVPAPKVEEPKKAAPVSARSVEEPKKAAPAKAEEPKSVPPKRRDDAHSGRDGEPGRGSPNPSSRRPASLRAVPALEDDDPSSISAEFFRKDQDSVPPVEEHEEEIEHVPAPVLSPMALARRARLRRLVAGVVSFAGVISIAVVGKAVSASKRPSMEPRRDTTASMVVDTAKMGDTPKPTTEPAQVVPAKEETKPAEAAKADDKKPEEAKPAETAKADDKKPEEAKKDDAKKDDAKPAPSGADAAELKKETLALLNRGKTKDAIEKAREAIAADPNDATSYLYLGSALQDSGKWKDGIEAYCECVRNATKGPVNECRAMGGHK